MQYLDLQACFEAWFNPAVGGSFVSTFEVWVLVTNVSPPISVHILSFVQVLPTFCPMIVQYLTTFCLCPTFDYFLSQNFQFLSRSVPVIVLISLTDLIFVLLLSTHLTPIQAKSKRQKLVKSWTWEFSFSSI